MQDIGTDTIELFVPARVHHNLPPRLRQAVRGQWIQVALEHNPHQPINRSSEDHEDAEHNQGDVTLGQIILPRGEVERQPGAEVGQQQRREKGYGTLSDSGSDVDEQGGHTHQGGTQSHYIFRRNEDSACQDESAANDTVTAADAARTISVSRGQVRVKSTKRRAHRQHNKRRDSRIISDMITPEEAAALATAMKQAKGASEDSGSDEEMDATEDVYAIALAGDSAPLLLVDAQGQAHDRQVAVVHVEVPLSDDSQNEHTVTVSVTSAPPTTV